MNRFARARQFDIIPEVQKEKEYGVCCGSNMSLESDEEHLKCIKCKKLVKYDPYFNIKAESQKTQYDKDGNIMYGKTIVKTDVDKIREISTEYSRKIHDKTKKYFPDEQLLNAAKLFYNVSKEHTKKKDKRDQLFAACLLLTSINDHYILTEKDLVVMLGLSTSGISKGMNLIIDYDIFHQLDINLDEFHHASIIRRYLGNIDNYDNKKGLLHPKYINTTEYIEFGIELIDIMLDNSIAYDTYITSKCAGVVYYIICKFKLAETKQDLTETKKRKGTDKIKSKVAQCVDVGQSTIVKVYNTLASPLCQDILPTRYQL